MKKLILMIALCLALTACTNPTDETSTDIQTETTEKQTETSITTTEDKSTFNQGLILYDENNVKISYNRVESTKKYISIYIEIENNSDSDLLILTKDSSVNDYMMHVAFSANVPADKKCISDIKVLESELNNSGLSVRDISTVEFKLTFSSPSHEKVFDDSDPIYLDFAWD